MDDLRSKKFASHEKIRSEKKKRGVPSPQEKISMRTELFPVPSGDAVFRWQRSQSQMPSAHTSQTQDGQAAVSAHASDLTIDALMQHNAQQASVAFP